MKRVWEILLVLLTITAAVLHFFVDTDRSALRFDIFSAALLLMCWMEESRR